MLQIKWGLDICCATCRAGQDDCHLCESDSVKDYAHWAPTEEARRDLLRIASEAIDIAKH